MRIARSTIHWPLVAVIGLLTGIGLLNLYSALHLWGAGTHLRLFWLQLLWIAIGGGFAWSMTRYDYRLLARIAPYIFSITLALLILVLLVGRVVGGNRNWLGIGGFGIQPSELAKLVVVLIFAKYFTDHAHPKGYRLTELLVPLGQAALLIGLVALEGDMGTTLFTALLAGSMVLFARLQWRSLLLIACLAALGATAAYTMVLKPSQRARVTSFLHPEADPRGKGYQVLQSKMAIGSGQLWGRGFMHGTVNKLRYLPEKHTDFIFPVWAEEWGFAGCCVVLAAYFFLITFAVEICQNAGDRFGGFMAVGIIFWLFWQVAINLGGVLGLMPLTGVTLPFFSYGGSSMLTTFLAMGILASIHRRRHLF